MIRLSPYKLGLCQSSSLLLKACPERSRRKGQEGEYISRILIKEQINGEKQNCLKLSLRAIEGEGRKARQSPCMANNLIVIPAKAGIHFENSVIIGKP
jgi:hypothetical protein